ncbi:MAG: hypothetical protein K8R58_15330 [Bacteroidales bacterium]|nr:hypothetical protein [Bacteroidales bacterium]
MKKLSIILILILVVNIGIGQSINCEVYKNDSLYYQACLQYTKACKYSQGSKSAQILLDNAIEICPYFSHAYYVKAIPYLKRGEFITWKKMIDKAVEHNTEEYLGYRGGARFQFLRDYKGAINDIEKIDSLLGYNIGYIYNGDYHLQIVRALSYKGLENKEKAIQIIEQQLTKENYDAGPFDYLHLGILKLEIQDYQGAIIYLKKQIEINDYLSESYYYLSLAYKSVNEKTLYIKNITKAKDYYINEKRLPGEGSFMDYMDKIYMKDIENELKTAYTRYK